jgi:hypothetical protein
LRQGIVCLPAHPLRTGDKSLKFFFGEGKWRQQKAWT